MSAPHGDHGTIDAWLEFTIRGLASAGFALALLLGAIRHRGIPGATPELPSLPLLAALGALTLFGAGYPLYRRMAAMLIQYRWDASVLIAVASVTAFLIALTLALAGSSPRAAWIAWTALIAAATLNGSWFLVFAARQLDSALRLWVRPEQS